VEIVVASSPWRRLIGLALRPRPAPPGRALLLPRCRSVHTCGMRYPLDLVWLDGAGAVLAVERGVRPWRLCSSAGAAAVIEVPAGQGDAAAGTWLAQTAANRSACT
jgi:uncharacterized membrane protein (UPF0127 family)